MADFIRRLSLFKIAAFITLVASAAAQSGSTPAKPASTQNTSHKISTGFSKVAVRALLTIVNTQSRALVDAVMIDLSAAQSSPGERKVVWHIQLFQQIYAVHELEGEHSEDQRCIVAWLPNLLGLSAEIPISCPRLGKQEMENMTRP